MPPRLHNLSWKGAGTMKVLLVNGSPNEKGCTFTALKEVESTLKCGGIETEIFQIGKKAVYPCIECGGCNRDHGCVFEDVLQSFIEKAKTADGFVFGTPVYFAAANGQLVNLMTRAWYCGAVDFAGKPAAAVVSCRRGGASATFDQVNKFFGISGMITVGSQYWNSVHGNTPDEVMQDLEGLQVMRTLGRNMAWIVKCIEAGKAQGITYPEFEPRVSTNFIR